MKEKHIVFLLSAAVVIMAGLSVTAAMSKDRKAPVISITNGTAVVYVEGEDTSILLKDVTAWDNKDGDLTDRIRIDNIIPDAGTGYATVVYAVYDSSNIVAKTKRVVQYKAKDDGEAED